MSPVPDLLGRDFTAEAPDQKWVGDFKQIDTEQGPVYLATVEDLFSRRMLGYATSDDYPTARLATAAINMAAATRGGDVEGVIFHTDKGSQYTSHAFAAACRRLGVTQSMGRVGCASSGSGIRHRCHQSDRPEGDHDDAKNPRRESVG